MVVFSNRFQNLAFSFWDKTTYISFIISILLNLAFRPGSVIVYFILYFKTAVTPKKGIENLRVAISSNGTFGDFQAKDLDLISEESTKSTTPKGIMALGILSIKLIGLHASSVSHFPFHALSYSSFPCLGALPSTSFCLAFLQYSSFHSKVLHFL